MRFPHRAKTPKGAANRERHQQRIVWKNGAGEGIRTLDPNLGKVVLYP
jgi:hypothetical protein